MTDPIGIDPLTVVLMGDPVAWARTRISKNGTLFTPARQRNNAAVLRPAAQEAMNGRAPLDCPVRVDLQAEFAIPASWSRRKQESALLGELRPGKRPDLSNIAKQIEDAFNAVVFRDDALIVEYGLLRKVYSHQPKLVVTVRPI
jgi:Holliday junction resolvase RusA-like endonuclease